MSKSIVDIASQTAVMVAIALAAAGICVGANKIGKPLHVADRPSQTYSGALYTTDAQMK